MELRCGSLFITRRGFRGGGVGWRWAIAFPQGFDPLPTQIVPHLILFNKSIFGRATLKFFKRRPRRQYTLILMGERAPKKRDCLVKFSKKCLKTPFLDCFFKCLPAAQKVWGTKLCLGRAQKINSVDLKKMSTKFLKTFENPRSAPVYNPPLLKRGRLWIRSTLLPHNMVFTII